MPVMDDADRTSILIVDDMPEKLLVYQAVLEELGQNLVPVLSGAEALKRGDVKMVRESLEELPDEFREVIVLRDLEELSYKQIAEIIKAPLGTVMSRLARAREKLKRILCLRLKEQV